MNAIQRLDCALYLHINAARDTPGWLKEVGIVIANDLLYGLPFLLVALWLAGGTARRGAAPLAIAVAIWGLGANQMIGML